MSNLHTFFIPYQPDRHFEPETIGYYTVFQSDAGPAWEHSEVIVLGYAPLEDFATLQAIRNELYRLPAMSKDLTVCDFGNFEAVSADTAEFERLAYVLYQLQRAGKLCILLSDSRAVLNAQIPSFTYMQEEEEKLPEVDFAYISSALDAKETRNKAQLEGVNFELLNRYPPLLSSFCALGVQKYRTTESELKLMKNLNFPVIRYGELHQQIADSEPYLREAKGVCLDFSAIRHADSPGSNRPSPAGFSSLEICQLARYVGASAHISSFSVCELNYTEDLHNQSCLLAAMVVWYCLEGRYEHPKELPNPENKQFRRYEVAVNAAIHKLYFLQSTLTNRWWLHVQNGKQQKWVACSEKDYQLAMQDEIPDRWWQLYYRLEAEE